MTGTFIYNDGGRANAGYKGDAGDCVTRAIAIATGKPYQEVYDVMFSETKKFAKTSRSRAAKKAGRGKGRSGTTPRNGVFKEAYKEYLESLDWKWTPTMAIGQGCKVHLKADELPKGTIIVKVSKHLVAVIDGVIHDTYDCSRNGTRCVYGYYTNDGVEKKKPVVKKILKVVDKISDELAIKFYDWAEELRNNEWIIDGKYIHFGTTKELLTIFKNEYYGESR